MGYRLILKNNREQGELQALNEFCETDGFTNEANTAFPLIKEVVCRLMDV